MEEEESSTDRVSSERSVVLRFLRVGVILEGISMSEVEDVGEEFGREGKERLGNQTRGEQERAND